jgi:chromate transporter
VQVLPEASVDGAQSAAAAATTSLRELALLFLRLGSTAFGGPAAHIAMMQEEVVRRRNWLSNERFLDLLGATNLIPGPNSTELAIHIGWERRRWAGLWVAGISFIAPAMLITLACAWAYVHLGTRAEAGWLLYGVKPVMVAVVLQALWGLAPRAARTPLLRVLGAAAIALVALGTHELLVLFGAGLLSVAIRYRSAHRDDVPSAPKRAYAPLAPLVFGLGASSATPASLFWVFAKIGSVLFGSGYVLIAFLRADLVSRLHWLTEAQLLDAVAVGQVTPGPVFTTATFIGYVLAGPSGALLATLGIFLPAFVFVALSGPLVPRLRASQNAGWFLDGVNVASLALMAVVTVQLGFAALIDLPTVGIAVVSVVLLVRFAVGSTWVIALGAAVGFAVHALR